MDWITTLICITVILIPFIFIWRVLCRFDRWLHNDDDLTPYQKKVKWEHKLRRWFGDE